MEIDLFKAEHLVPLDYLTLGVDAYVKASYGGSTIKSKIIKTGNSNKAQNPVFSDRLKVACMLPNN